jgi:hypothetical protein
MRPGRESDHTPPYSAEVKGTCLQLPNRFPGEVLNEAKGQLYVFISSSNCMIVWLLNNESRKDADAGESARGAIEILYHNLLEGTEKSQRAWRRIDKNVKDKTISVTGREGSQGCETPLPYFLDSRLTDGGEVVSLMRRLPFTPWKTPGTHFC